MSERQGIDVLLARARQALVRVDPLDLNTECRSGALIVDIRPTEQRFRDGELPGSLIIDRNVLEWRLDPSCEFCIPQIQHWDTRIVLVCNEGYSSSLAAATLQEMGLRRATDLIGGYQAWKKLQESSLTTARPT